MSDQSTGVGAFFAPSLFDFKGDVFAPLSLGERVGVRDSAQDQCLELRHALPPPSPPGRGAVLRALPQTSTS